MVLENRGWKCRIRWPLILFTLFLAIPIQAEPARILTLRDNNQMQGRHCYRAFRNHLKTLGVDAIVEDVLLEVTDPEQQLRRVLENFTPQLIFAQGCRATGLATRLLGGVPLVAGLVFHASLLHQEVNATGVVLEYPPARQLEWIHDLLPKVHKLGVIYSDENIERIQQARISAKTYGLQLVAKRVNHVRDLPEALSEVLDQVDLLWGLTDTLVLTDETTRAVLLASFRSGVPLIGMSASWTRAGALLALDWDYSDLGKQCAILAEKVLNGIPPQRLAPEPPRKLVYSLNLKTVQHMKLVLPDSVSSNAIAVYQ